MSNRQKYIIMVESGLGTTWAVATPTQRGFTEEGAKIAVANIQKVLPLNWSCWIDELTPLTYLMESIEHIRKKG